MTLRVCGDRQDEYAAACVINQTRLQNVKHSECLYLSEVCAWLLTWGFMLSDSIFECRFHRHETEPSAPCNPPFDA